MFEPHVHVVTVADAVLEGSKAARCHRSCKKRLHRSSANLICDPTQAKLKCLQNFHSVAPRGPPWPDSWLANALKIDVGGNDVVAGILLVYTGILE